MAGITFAYDSSGFRDSVASPAFGTVRFTHTKFGELKTRADGKGTTTWTRDKLGRATKRKDPDGVAEWRYDPTMPKRALGALERRCYKNGAAATGCAGSMMDPDFREALEYDGDARLKQSTTTIGAPAVDKTYIHGYTYYADGRLKTVSYPSGLTAHHAYSARGYRSELRRDSSSGALLERRAAMDARGNVTGVTYGNGVTTTRAFDPKTGRPTDIDTVSSGATKIQDNAYAWRSDGLLSSRASHVGRNNAKLEEFAHDPLGRLTTATTKLNNTTRRTLSQTYDARGNLKTKTSSVGADIDVSSYSHTDAARPNRLKTATIDGKSHTFGYDADGNITGYDCTSAGCGDDKFIDWNGRNLPARITLGASGTTAEPTARDEFAYGPDGARYHRKTTHMDGRTLRTEHTYYVGAFEELLPRAGAAHTSIRQTRVTDGVRHVKTTAAATDDEGEETTTTASYVDYMHRDHLGSVEGTTDASGARTRTFAHDPFGERRKADWTAALTESERVALEAGADPRTRGHTGHEHLERTGFIHRGGRVYDPTLGRFLSPDPLVADRASAQAWNGYSYVSNSPMSFVDPSGLSQAPVRGGCVMVGFACQQGGAATGGFGLASVVSTHRFHWVDIFFSFVSSWFNPGWGPVTSPGWIPHPYNSWGGGGVGDGGWGSYDSFGSFHFGIAYYSVAFQVTSHVAVAGTPDISARDMAAGSTETPDAPTPVSARDEGRNVIIVYSDGSVERRSGGTRAWRNNNPGNLRQYPFSIQRGSLGEAGGFAIFASEAQGHRALLDLLSTERYQNTTINEAIEIYAPSNENDTANFQDFVRETTGLSGEVRLNTLTDLQIHDVANAIRRMEGWRPGTVTIQ